MLKLFLLSITLILSSSLNQWKNKDNNRICWEQDRKLTWKDFRGSVNTSIDSASAATAYVIQYKVLSNKSILISNCFIKNRSWYKKNHPIRHVLMHEQYHFNLAEVYARKIRKEVGNLEQARSDTLNKIYNRLIRECIQAQDIYDDETNHSQDEFEQRKWEQKIDEDLESLNAFKNPVVVLK